MLNRSLMTGVLVVCCASTFADQEFDPALTQPVQDRIRGPVTGFLQDQAPNVKKLALVVRDRQALASSESRAVSAEAEATDRMATAIAGFLVEDFRKAGIEATVVATATPSADTAVLEIDLDAAADGLTVNWRLTAKDAGEEKSTSDVVDAGLILSTAGYSGLYSFEARRWVPVDGKQGKYKLQNIDLPEAPIFRGADAERTDFKALKKGIKHPLTNPEFPYGLGIEVEGRQRPLVNINGQIYSALEVGEEYKIRFWNNSPRYVLTALYVDGINTINQGIQMPHLTPTTENWYLVPGRSAVLGGWATIRDQQNINNSETSFWVTDEDAMMVANVKQKPDRIGTITAVFYAYETEKEQTPVLPDGRGGTAEGKRLAQKYEFDISGRKKDVILAAVSIHYRPAKEIEELKRSGAAAPESQLVKQGSFRIPKREDLPAELKVSETKPFPRRGGPLD